MKLKEIIENVTVNREAVYDFIKGRADTLTIECADHMGMEYNRTKKYLEWLLANGYLTRVRRVNGSRREYMYNVSSIPYNIEVIRNKPDAVDARILAVTRVIKSSDKHRECLHKIQRTLRSSSGKGGMQSSMQMFGGW